MKPPGLGETLENLDLVCIKCGDTFDAATEVVDKEQRMFLEPGDITVCMTCGYIGAIGKDLKMREMTEAERVVVENDPQNRSKIEIALNAIPYFSSGSKH